jgi:hypothetical protein
MGRTAVQAGNILFSLRNRPNSGAEYKKTKENSHAREETFNYAEMESVSDGSEQKNNEVGTRQQEKELRTDEDQSQKRMAPSQPLPLLVGAERILARLADRRNARVETRATSVNSRKNPPQKHLRIWTAQINRKAENIRSEPSNNWSMKTEPRLKTHRQGQLRTH